MSCLVSFVGDYPRYSSLSIKVYVSKDVMSWQINWVVGKTVEKVENYPVLNREFPVESLVDTVDNSDLS